ncbi:MAG TPA: DUF1698 domain-containing protein, partial [Pyrinomonadaceae bacterium]|nr:DUF1698 domain-containing protein [Pyrinomonadaceae bacterium]
LMKREEIEAGIERLRPWFHCIELGEGLRTKTGSAVGEPVEHPRATWEFVRPHLPEDLSGKSLLDVGCNAGFYCVEAKRRGAARVVGVDSQRHLVRQARFVSRALGLEMEFEKMSVYELDPRSTGQFDVTLALGLVYHLKHLVLGLERLFHVTHELLILESAVYPPECHNGSFCFPVGGLTPALHTLAYVENDPEAKEAIYNWFLPSPEALAALLRNVGFDEVGIHPGERLDRAVLVARKRGAYPDSRAVSYLNAALSFEQTAETCAPGDELSFRVRVENSGFARWLRAGEPADDRGAVHLAAHLLTEDGDELAWYHAGAYLPRDMLPGDAATVEIRMRAPAEPGTYRLVFDMVAEQLAWFEDLGSATLEHTLRVQ